MKKKITCIKYTGTILACKYFSSFNKFTSIWACALTNNLNIFKIHTPLMQTEQFVMNCKQRTICSPPLNWKWQHYETTVYSDQSLTLFALQVINIWWVDSHCLGRSFFAFVNSVPAYCLDGKCVLDGVLNPHWLFEKIVCYTLKWKNHQTSLMLTNTVLSSQFLQTCKCYGKPANYITQFVFAINCFLVLWF